MDYLRKGQSAIEYLVTYGWMLLAIAIVGGSIFNMVDDRNYIKSVSDLSNDDVQIENFGYKKGGGLSAEIRATSANPIENLNVSLVNQETGKSVHARDEVIIPAAQTEKVYFPNVKQSKSKNSLNVVLLYNTSNLENLRLTGGIKGKIKLNTSNKKYINAAPTAAFTTNATQANVGDTIQFDASSSDDSDGSIDTYQWDWTNDGKFESKGLNPEKTYSSSGIKVVNLSVTDDEGKIDTTTKSIDINHKTANKLISFETGNLSDWTGDTGSFNVNKERSYDGSYALDLNGGNNKRITYPGVKLTRNSSIKMRGKWGGNSINAYFWFTDNQSTDSSTSISGYQFSSPNAGGRIKIERVDNGNSNNLYDSGYNTGDRSPGEWLKMKAEMTESGELRYRMWNSNKKILRDSGYISDSKYDNLYLSIRRSNDIHLDNISITN